MCERTGVVRPQFSLVLGAGTVTGRHEADPPVARWFDSTPDLRTQRRAEPEKECTVAEDTKTEDPKPVAPAAPKKARTSKPKSPSKPKAERKQSERKKGDFAIVTMDSSPNMKLVERNCANMGDAMKRLRAMITIRTSVPAPGLAEGESYGIIQIKATGIIPTIETVTKVML